MASPVVMSARAAPSVKSNSTGSGSTEYQNAATQVYLEKLDTTLAQNYLWALLGVVALVFLYTVIIRLNAHVRHLASMSNEGALRYFSKSTPTISALKSNVLYSPILYYRRAREIRFSRHVNLGTLPTRFQSTFIVLLVITNVFASTWNVPWSDPQLEVLPILRNRTGTLSVANLIPIVVLSSVKNPLIYLLDISYDSFSLMHRWLGRLAVLQAIAHTICYVITTVHQKGWQDIKVSLRTEPFLAAGLVATIAVTVMLIHTPKLFRSLSYEFFHHLHVVLAVFTMAFLWRHLALKSLPQRYLLLGAAVIWASSRAFRFATLLYRSIGKESCKVKIQSLPGGAVKVSFTPPRPWTHRPGQSLYLTIPSIGLWTAHPFSVAWSEVEESLSRASTLRSVDEKEIKVRNKEIDLEVPGKQVISLIVKRHSGFTRKLWERAEKSSTALTVNAFIEGPYGTERSLSSYGTVMLFASGVGITHQLPYVRELVEGYRQGTVATKRITLVWVMPTTECLEWVRGWMQDVLSMEGRREVLKILLFITRGGLNQSIRSPSDMVQISRGRPNVHALMWDEVQQKMGCLGVSVCAGGGLADEVRRVSRVMLDRGANLDLIEEGFGW
ncbi:ferric-chelate reductase [Exophiala viscosa]|uniref:Ferric-chelate reductase n=1 Tax=Exophiala viscosa TaxID=2486360 RepID=A0AAN6IAV6_9EURO|nr:ferric-chelate reductase [Exophiala viscosa]